MTLTEARRKFEMYKLNELKREELKEAVDAAMTVLHPSARERMGEIRALILGATGTDPFSSRSRKREAVCWRQCVWRLMRDEGYGPVEIASACDNGYSYSTVIVGAGKIRDYLSTGDRMAVETWRDFLAIMEGK